MLLSASSISTPELSAHQEQIQENLLALQRRDQFVGPGYKDDRLLHTLNSISFYSIQSKILPEFSSDIRVCFIILINKKTRTMKIRVVKFSICSIITLLLLKSLNQIKIQLNVLWFSNAFQKVTTFCVYFNLGFLHRWHQIADRITEIGQILYRIYIISAHKSTCQMLVKFFLS